MTVTLPTSRSIAMHEAHHAAALCLSGMVPMQVRTDHPRRDRLGLVSVDWGEAGVDRDGAKRVLVAILVGGMTEGVGGWQEWPIDPGRLPEGACHDAEAAAVLAGYIGVTDRATWMFYVWKANRLARGSQFRRLAVALADELERVEMLSAEDLGTCLRRSEPRCKYVNVTTTASPRARWSRSRPRSGTSTGRATA